MKKIFLATLAIILLIGLLFSGCTKTTTPTTEPGTVPTSAAPAATTSEPVQPIVLKWLITNQGINEMNWDWNVTMGGTDGWAKKVEAATGGQVKFEYMIGAVTADAMYNQLVAGAGDIATNVILINSGRFPILELMTVPDLFSTCQRPSMVAYEMWREIPEIQEEFSEAKILSIHATVPSPPGIGFATVDKPIYTLEDTKGVKMGQYGKWGTKTAEALGFTPVAVPNPAIYENIQRGVVDGSFMATNFLTIQNVGELVKYWHPITSQFCPFWFSINWDTWNKLPTDIQGIMLDLAPAIPDLVDKYCREEQVKVLAQWPEVQVVSIAPEEQERWKKAQDPVQAEYIAELTAKGLDGQAIFDKMMSLIDQYAEAPAE